MRTYARTCQCVHACMHVDVYICCVCCHVFVEGRILLQQGISDVPLSLLGAWGMHRTPGKLGIPLWMLVHYHHTKLFFLYPVKALVTCVHIFTSASAGHFTFGNDRSARMMPMPEQLGYAFRVLFQLRRSCHYVLETQSFCARCIIGIRTDISRGHITWAYVVM